MKAVIPAIAAVCGLLAAGAVLVLHPPTLDAAVASGLRAPPAGLNVRLGTRPRAVADLERQVRGPRRNDIYAWRYLGEAYRVRGETRAAQAAWRRCERLSERLTREPDLADSPTLWFCLGWSRWRLGDEGAGEALRRAEELLQERVGARRLAPQIWANIGYCRLARGEQGAAADAWGRALQAFHGMHGEAPEGGEALYDLACYLALNGDGERAIDALTRAADAGWRDGMVEWDPDLDILRGDPRFDEVAARILSPVSTEDDAG